MKKGQRSKTRIFKDVEQLSYGKQPSRQKLSEWTWLRTDMEVDYKNLRRLDKVNRELLFTAFFLQNRARRPQMREIGLHHTRRSFFAPLMVEPCNLVPQDVDDRTLKHLEGKWTNEIHLKWDKSWMKVPFARGSPEPQTVGSQGNILWSYMPLLGVDYWVTWVHSLAWHGSYIFVDENSSCQ